MQDMAVRQVIKATSDIAFYDPFAAVLPAKFSEQVLNGIVTTSFRTESKAAFAEVIFHDRF
jgi:hypothetical protein